MMTAHARPPELRVLGLRGMPEVSRGDDLTDLIVAAVRRADLTVQAGDVFVVTHKIVSKAEGQVVRLAEIEPSALAERWGASFGKDARLFELALRAARRIVRMDRGVLIAETPHGFVCANAGVDSSNIAREGAALLPEDPDESARRLCVGLCAAFGRPVAVIISDSFGRAWRQGQVNVALGVAGLRPIVDYRGRQDAHGHQLQATAIAIADELASAAELVMGKTDAIPVALIKGARYQPGEGSARELIRTADEDLFR